MEEYRILPIDNSYNDQMLAILRSAPINSSFFKVCFDKSPDVFAIPGMKYSECLYLGFFCGSELKGFASLGYHDALIGGKSEKVFCLFHFYLLPEARGRHFPEKAFEIFQNDYTGKAKFGYYLTLKGNRQSEIFIGRRPHTWSPRSSIAGDLVDRSLIFLLPRRNKASYAIRTATLNDIPSIVNLLNAEQCKRDLGNVIDESTFIEILRKRRISIENYFIASDRKGRPVGTCLAWDCSSLRRTQVLSFSPDFYPLLWSYKLLGSLFHMAPLPAEGECFSELTITDYAAEDRNPEILHALLSGVYYRNHNGKYHFMNFGSFAKDKLLDAAKDSYSGTQCQALSSSGQLVSNPS